MEIANFTSALTEAFTLLERYRTKKVRKISSLQFHHFLCGPSAVSTIVCRILFIIIFYHPPPSKPRKNATRFNPLSFTKIHYNLLPFTTINYHSPTSTIINYHYYHPLLSATIHYYPLPSTTIHYHSLLLPSTSNYHHLLE